MTREEELSAALKMMADDCEHLLNILAGKAYEEWDYEYQRKRIQAARAAIVRRDR